MPDVKIEILDSFLPENPSGYDNKDDIKNIFRLSLSGLEGCLEDYFWEIIYCDKRSCFCKKHSYLNRKCFVCWTR